MDMHKRIRLTPLDRKEVWRLYQTRQWKVTLLAQHYRVRRPTIYNVLKKARFEQFTPSNSTNAKRYNKSYPGELVHVDTKHLPLLKGQKKTFTQVF